MKHAKPEYNRIQDPENLIGEDEPVFLLRSQDRLAPDFVNAWGLALLEIGGNPETAQQAIDHADKMRQWQQEHGSKIPD